MEDQKLAVEASTTSRDGSVPETAAPAAITDSPAAAKVAFQARLSPETRPVAPEASEPASQASRPEPQAAAVTPLTELPADSTPVLAGSGSGDNPGRHDPAPAGGESPAASRLHQPAAAETAGAPQQTSAGFSAYAVEPLVNRAAGDSGVHHAPAEAAQKPPQTPELPAAATPDTPTLRTIQFQVGEGDGRVDVRMAERAGEVRVDVRTPDNHLAGALRADLPALTAHLEQTGFHAETWRPAAAEPRDPQATSAAAGHGADEQPSGNGRGRQGEGQREQPQQPENSLQPKSDRKDFRWLFTSLR